MNLKTAIESGKPFRLNEDWSWMSGQDNAWILQNGIVISEHNFQVDHILSEDWEVLLCKKHDYFSQYEQDLESICPDREEPKRYGYKEQTHYTSAGEIKVISLKEFANLVPIHIIQRGPVNIAIKQSLNLGSSVFNAASLPSVCDNTIIKKTIPVIPRFQFDLVDEIKGVLLDAYDHDDVECEKDFPRAVQELAINYIKQTGDSNNPFLVEFATNRYALIHPEDFKLYITENSDHAAVVYVSGKPINYLVHYLKENDHMLDALVYGMGWQKIAIDEYNEPKIEPIAPLDVIPDPMCPDHRIFLIPNHVQDVINKHVNEHINLMQNQKVLSLSKVDTNDKEIDDCYLDPFGYLDGVVPIDYDEDIKCECGSESIGYTTHSEWCPKHNKG